jgi:hypothetical protein
MHFLPIEFLRKIPVWHIPIDLLQLLLFLRYETEKNQHLKVLISILSLILRLSELNFFL